MQYSFADIILPVAVRGTFTYAVPVSFSELIGPGSKVLVPFGPKKLYSGIVLRLHNEKPDLPNLRELISVSGELTINRKQLEFWKWLSDYYMCSIGEVMKAALPSALFPDSDQEKGPVEKYRPRMESFVELTRSFTDKELNEILDKLGKAPKQCGVLISYLSISGYAEGLPVKPVKKALLLKDNAGQAAIEGLVRKSVLRTLILETGRLRDPELSSLPLRELTPVQLDVMQTARELFRAKNIVLMHGVTSSGKTEIYIQLIDEQLKKGKQVLYLLPEIALTAQIVIRLQKHFGKDAGVYHSRFNDQEKAEIWKKAASSTDGYKLIIGVRSSVFLPLSNLGLIIIDEEHDTSYKQNDPAPRYNGRDAAIMLASLHGAKCLLGSATPSVETYFNAVNGRYGLVELNERYGSIKMPSIILANTREAYRKKLMVSHFTPELLYTMDEALSRNEQVILFQNRRGFSPYIDCPECGWIPVCINCSVNLTYHKAINRLVCHYCGYDTALPHSCGSCGSKGLVTRGFGTEKIEDEIRFVFPKARVARMDQDSTKGKNSFGRLIEAFEDGRTDILIGTQMISKGLDFENLTVVGILNADNMMSFPDFRAHERSYQMLAQVSGRAGRRKKQGRVVIQTTDPSNQVIRLVLLNDYKAMYRHQIEERRNFNYPPFFRLIRVSLKHKDRAELNNFSEQLAAGLRAHFGRRILGPEFPPVSRIQEWYIKNILVKVERERSQSKAKALIRSEIEKIETLKGAGGLRIITDVDPY
jgi:primosomal protein N' (replication factor Y)